MAITPDTNIRIIKSPLTLDNKNQLTFATKQAQEAYFLSLPYIEIESCSYQRKDNIIRFPANIDSILEYNYVMYQNDNYSDKWFYAFITNMEYYSDNTTYITIATDVWQTWQFDITFKESFIEREHILKSEDIPGSNLVPESLETGEIVTENTISINEIKPAYIIAFNSGPGGYSAPRTGSLINGIPTGVFYQACDYKGMLDTIYDLNLSGETNKIMCIFTIPAIAINSLQGYSWDQWIGSTGYAFPFFDLNQPDPTVVSIFKAPEYTKQILSKPTSINNYQPVNKKLLTYPYCYFGFNGNSQHLYRYEDFSTNDISFKIMSEINPNPCCLFVPLNYKNISENMSEACNIQDYPQISWSSDTFNIWMAQNSQILKLNMEQEQFNYDMTLAKDMINYAINSTSNAVGLNINGLTSDTANVLMNTYQNKANHDFYIKQQMAQIEKQKLMPDNGTLGSSNATYIGYNKLNNSLFFKFAIKPQFAEKIDDYFSMYGYATNEVKLPNLNNRSNWNYVKTIGANIMGNIPQADLSIIKSLFDNGITLWHTTSYFLDYSQANN